jgi:hypothetical protein
MGRQLVAVMKDAGTLVASHLWVILAAAVIPIALACITSVVLVLSVDRSKRVEAIKSLPPVIAALNQSTASRLRALESRNKSASPQDRHC